MQRPEVPGFGHRLLNSRRSKYSPSFDERDPLLEPESAASDQVLRCLRGQASSYELTLPRTWRGFVSEDAVQAIYLRPDIFDSCACVGVGPLFSKGWLGMG